MSTQPVAQVVARAMRRLGLPKSMPNLELQNLNLTKVFASDAAESAEAGAHQAVFIACHVVSSTDLLREAVAPCAGVPAPPALPSNGTPAGLGLPGSPVAPCPPCGPCMLAKPQSTVDPAQTVAAVTATLDSSSGGIS